MLNMNNPGVRISDSGTDQNVVSGNFIGTNANGTGTLPNKAGITINNGAQHNTIGGITQGERNIVSGNTDPIYAAGVWLSDSGTSFNKVIGNYIGSDVTGTKAIGNGGGPYNGAGVSISDGASQNSIGGNAANERNLISGNNGVGVQILFGASQNTISGNYIGTDVSGTKALSNTSVGVQIGHESRNNVIGGDNGTPGSTCSGECNLVSGNAQSGLGLSDSNSDYNLVTGNYIGTDASGTVAIPNGDTGVVIYGGANHNTIGGDAPVERNVISGNSAYGVGIGGANSNIVKGNYIGTDVSGNNALGNSNDGVRLWGTSRHNIIGKNNLIAFNGMAGVQVEGNAAVNNTITQNAIHSNANVHQWAEGITLKNGGNTELYDPIIITYNLAAGTVTGQACVSCTVEIFSDDEDEGRVYEGTTTADAGGKWSYSKGSALAGPRITATATDTSGNTSAFGTHR